jgi:hypothetical protein
MVIQDQTMLQGTIVDNRVLACIGGSEGMFALGVIVKAASDEFCVYLLGTRQERLERTLASSMIPRHRLLRSSFNSFRPTLTGRRTGE